MSVSTDRSGCSERIQTRSPDFKESHNKRKDIIRVSDLCSHFEETKDFIIQKNSPILRVVEVEKFYTFFQIGR